jgi:hypothetical protein
MHFDYHCVLRRHFLSQLLCKLKIELSFVKHAHVWSGKTNSETPEFNSNCDRFVPSLMKFRHVEFWVVSWVECLDYCLPSIIAEKKR